MSEENNGLKSAAGLSDTAVLEALLKRHDAQMAAVAGVGSKAVPIIIGEGDKVASLERLLMKPSRPRGELVCHDPVSFIDSVNRECDSAALVVHDLSSDVPRISAVSNYIAGWRDHRVLLSLQESRQMKFWRGFIGKRMKPSEFADAIEAHSDDFVDPRSASLIEMVRSLRVHGSVTWNEASDPDTSAIHLTYVRESKATAGKATDIELRRDAKIEIPLYVGDVKVSVDIRLQHLLTDTALQVWFACPTLQTLVEKRNDDICKQIVDGVKNIPHVRGVMPSPVSALV